MHGILYSAPAACCTTHVKQTHGPAAGRNYFYKLEWIIFCFPESGIQRDVKTVTTLRKNTVEHSNALLNSIKHPVSSHFTSLCMNDDTKQTQA